MVINIMTESEKLAHYQAIKNSLQFQLNEILSKQYKIWNKKLPTSQDYLNAVAKCTDLSSAIKSLELLIDELHLSIGVKENDKENS